MPGVPELCAEWCSFPPHCFAADELLMAIREQHDRCLEVRVRLCTTSNLQARLFSPLVLGKLMEIEERARKAGILD